MCHYPLKPSHQEPSPALWAAVLEANRAQSGNRKNDSGSSSTISDGSDGSEDTKGSWDTWTDYSDDKCATKKEGISNPTVGNVKPHA